MSKQPETYFVYQPHSRTVQSDGERAFRAVYGNSKNLITPEVMGHFVSESFYIELSQGPGILGADNEIVVGISVLLRYQGRVYHWPYLSEGIPGNPVEAMREARERAKEICEMPRKAIDLLHATLDHSDLDGVKSADDPCASVLDKEPSRN